MPKSTDVPHELRPLNKIFSAHEYKWDYADSFRDWVDFLTESFMPKREGVYEQLKKKHGSLDWFVEMTNEWVLLQHRQVNGPVDRATDRWYDALGTYYEVLASGSKKQILGQFFTPPELCTMMSRFNGVSEELTGKGLTVHDPCSGSGRMLVAWHVLAPGNYQYGADLDPICAKMTAVNMCIHGCVGQAVCMDSLQPDQWRFGYQINRVLGFGGGPTIEPIQKEQCRVWQQWQHQKAEHAKQKAENPDLPPPTPQMAKTAKMGQLSLF